MRPVKAWHLARLVRAPLVGAATLLSSAAWAQPGDAHRAPRPLAQSLQGTAKDAYTAATALFKQGDFAGSEAKYSQAYDLSKDARLVFDMAVCEKELHHYARMAVLLRRYKEEAGASLSAEDRTKVDDALDALPKYIGTVVVSVDTAGVTVTVDGEPVGTTPLAAPVPLDPGKHTVSLRKEGYESVERPISVSPGVSSTVTIELLAQSAPSSARAEAPQHELPGAAPESTVVTRWTPLAYAGVGVAAAGVGVGSVTGALALARVGSVKSHCSGSVCPTSVDGDLKSASTLGDVSTVAFIAAGVGAAVGAAALFLWPRRDHVGSASVAVAPWIGPGAAGVEGSF